MSNVTEVKELTRTDKNQSQADSFLMCFRFHIIFVQLHHLRIAEYDYTTLVCDFIFN